MKKDAAAAAAEKKGGADDESYELDSNDEEAKQDPLTRAKDPLRHSKDASPDQGVCIGFHHDGTEIHAQLICAGTLMPGTTNAFFLAVCKVISRDTS